jgi:sugar phosphate isomerase/epimerase
MLSAPPPVHSARSSGNPLHSVDSAREDRLLRGALQLAEGFQIQTVVTMAGLPAARDDRFPPWITTVRPPEDQPPFEHQWTVAVEMRR